MEPSWLQGHKYPLLLGLYVIITGGAIIRIWRQPYSRNVKGEQIESIFKGTTLGAVVLGIAMSGQINKARSDTHQSSTDQV
ncbi:hypothetical protein XPA_001916 [Xanthoria parietina]